MLACELFSSVQGCPALMDDWPPQISVVLLTSEVTNPRLKRFLLSVFPLQRHPPTSYIVLPLPHTPTFVPTYSRTITEFSAWYVQWNLSNWGGTNGPEEVSLLVSVLISEVEMRARVVLGVLGKGVLFIERCPQFKSVLIERERFHIPFYWMAVSV